MALKGRLGYQKTENAQKKKKKKSACTLTSGWIETQDKQLFPMLSVRHPVFSNNVEYDCECFFVLVHAQEMLTSIQMLCISPRY